MRIRPLQRIRSEQRTVLVQCLPALDVVTPCLLRQVAQALSATQAAQLQDDVQIVIAEAVNNIVEHAYAGQSLGALVLHMTVSGTSLEIVLLDWGRPFPHPDAPPTLPDPCGLSEGGYGWFLIRSLVSHVCHSRDAGKNRLSLTFSLPDPLPA